jgi:peroxiredoxin
MRIRHTLFIFATCILSLCFPAMSQIGVKSATLKLTDANGNKVSLDDFAGRIVVLEFWSFKCPVALAYDQRMAFLQSKYRERGVEFLAVASNKNESVAEVVRNAENLKIAMRVWFDPDGSCAEICGATHTPSVVVLDGSGVIRYRGAIDNNRQPNESGRIAYVENALESLLATRPVDPAETKVFGCSIRR